MKKSFIIFIIFIALFLIVSCEFPTSTGTEYKITYVSGDDIIFTNLPTYISGNEYNLPEVEKDDATFLGWYNNANFNGDKITKIFSNEYGDKVYYAKWEEQEVIIPSLSDICNKMTNYTAYINYNDAYLDLFYVDKNKTLTSKEKQNNNYDNYYLDYSSSITTLYFSLNNKYYYLDENDEDYDTFNHTYDNFFINILPSLYRYDDKTASFISINGNDAINNFYQFDDNYKDASISLILKNNYISKINIYYKLNNEDININIEILNVNKTVINIPQNVTHYEKEEIINDNILKILALPATLNLPKGTLLEEIIEQISLYVYYKDGTHEEVDSTLWKIEIDDFNGNIAGEYTANITYLNFETSIKVIIEKDNDDLFVLKIGDYKTITQIQDENGLDHGMPSTGNVKVLVVPVTFTNYPAPVNLENDLKTVFFGDEESTGWESFASYYKKSSYNKLNISGTVTSPVSLGVSSSTFESRCKKDEDNFDIYIENVIETLSTTINLAEYDSDNDGILDALYLIYTAPVNYDDDESFFWAFTSYLVDNPKYDNTRVNYYFWAGTDFYNEIPESSAKLSYNSETFIHETGHMMGLDDYYDYDSYSNGGSGGGNMMDYNVGDFDAYSKLILGWISPYVVLESANINLKKFNVEGSAIIIPKTWSNNNIFSEYFIIEYYTPDGLNRMEAGYSGLPKDACIIIYHIDATLNSKRNMEDAWSITKYHNCSSSSHKLISLVEADNNNSISKGRLATANDYFKANSTFNFGKWYNNKSVGFVVNIGELKDTASINITF